MGDSCVYIKIDDRSQNQYCFEPTDPDTTPSWSECDAPSVTHSSTPGSSPSPFETIIFTSTTADEGPSMTIIVDTWPPTSEGSSTQRTTPEEGPSTTIIVDTWPPTSEGSSTQRTTPEEGPRSSLTTEGSTQTTPGSTVITTEGPSTADKVAEVSGNVDKVLEKIKQLTSSSSSAASMTTSSSDTESARFKREIELRTTTYTCSEFSTKVELLLELMEDLSRLDELITLAADMADATVEACSSAEKNALSAKADALEEAQEAFEALVTTEPPPTTRSSLSPSPTVLSTTVPPSMTSHVMSVTRQTMTSRGSSHRSSPSSP